MGITYRVNSLPHNKILDFFKLKAFPDDHIHMPQMMKFVFDTIENIVRQRENSGNQHFLLFPQCFQKASSAWVLKLRTVW